MTQVLYLVKGAALFEFTLPDIPEVIESCQNYAAVLSANAYCRSMQEAIGRQMLLIKASSGLPGMV